MIRELNRKKNNNGKIRDNPKQDHFETIYTKYAAGAMEIQLVIRRISKIIALCILVLVVFFIGMYVYTWGEYPVAKTVTDDPTIPNIRVNNAVFHAETFGQTNNPVIIVVHGGPGWDYRSLLPLKELADHYYVVFYDQRGTGLSPRVDSQQLSLESSLSDLHAMVQHYSPGKPVILIGHSWGGMLVTAYLGQHPERVSHAVLAEPGFLTSEMAEISGVRFGPRWEAGFLWRATLDWFESLHVENHDGHARADYFLGKVAPYANSEYYCHNKVPQSAKLYWRAGAQASNAIIGKVTDSQGRIQIDLTKGLKHYTKPVLILASECNRLGGIEFQKRQSAFFANTRMVVIRHSGHMMFSEQPQQSLRAVREYLLQN